MEEPKREKLHRALLSRFRRLYQGRFVFRCLVLAGVFALYLLRRDAFDVLIGFNCFRRLSLLDILWLVWMLDMILQLAPARTYWPLGSQKFRPENFRQIASELLDYKKLYEFVRKSGLDTLKIGLIWAALTVGIWLLYRFTNAGPAEMLLICALFYVCDVICVLFWCPFRALIMKNRCCTTCRIFNWDHIMMFSPLLFVPGFYTWTLCLAAIAVFAVWELTFYLHPERYWEGANESLRCANCTDILCGRRNCGADDTAEVLSDIGRELGRRRRKHK